MRAIRILKIDDPILMNPVEDVLPESLQRVLKCVPSLALACSRQNGLAITATQIGRPYNLFYAVTPGLRGVYINPKITDQSTETTVLKEECLSIPGIAVGVERPKYIVLQYLDVKGTERAVELVGQAARVAQHEHDHLVGLSIFDWVAEEDRAKLQSVPLYKRWESQRQTSGHAPNAETAPHLIRTQE